jgi:hypothetical protein
MCRFSFYPFLRALRAKRRMRPVVLLQLIQGAQSTMADIIKNVGSTVHSVPVEKNAEGGNVPIVPANIQYSVDNPEVGQLTQNADGSADVLGLMAGTVTLTVKDTAFNLSSSKTLQFNLDTVPTSIDQQLS